MVHDVILYIDFRLLVLLICWFCKEMLGRTTAERKLGFPSVMSEVLSFGNILVQRKNELRAQCQLLSYNSWKEIYLKIKVGVFFFFLPTSAFFWVTSNGTRIQWQMGPTTKIQPPWSHSVSLLLFPSKHSVCKRNLNIYPENLTWLLSR